MRQLLPKSWLLRCFLGILSFIILGYFSNAVSMDFCESATQSWVAQKIARSDWPPRIAFSEGAAFQWPWIIGVNYTWQASPTGGKWGTRYYVSLFGVGIPIGEKVRLIG